MRARAALLAVALAAGAWPAAARQARGRLARIPPADHARYAEEWKTRWRNPRVLVDRDGVYLLVGGAPLGERDTPVEDLAAALAALPRKAWPYGRIVALTRTPRVPASHPLERVRAVLDALGVEAIETPVGCGCGGDG